VTNRRKPALRTTGAAWKPTRPRSELFKAIGAGAAVALVTVLAIFVMKPPDSPSTPSVTTPVTTPTQSIDPTGTLPASSTPTLPASSTTTPAP
jgi:hypothetical protein